MTLSERLIKFHAWQGKSNDCGPFTTAMALNALHDQKIFEPAQLAKEMNRPVLRWRGPLPIPVIRRLPNYATMPWGIADVLGEHGVGARWRFGATPDELWRALSERRLAMPIIGEIKLPRLIWAHVKILVAHEATKGVGFIDPAHPKAEVVWQNEEQFMRLWNNWKNLLVETL